MIKKFWKHLNQALNQMRVRDVIKGGLWTLLLNLHINFLADGFEKAVHFKENLITAVGVYGILSMSAYFGTLLLVDYRKKKDKNSLKYGSFLVGIPIFDGIYKLLAMGMSPNLETGASQVTASLFMLILAVISSYALKEKLMKKSNKKEQHKESIASLKPLKGMVASHLRDMNIDDSELDEMLDNFKTLQREVKMREKRDIEELHDIDQMIERLYRLCYSYDKISEKRKEEMKQEVKEILSLYIEKLERIIEQDDERYIQEIKVLRRMED